MGRVPDKCIRCSDTQKYVGVQVFSHKTGGNVVPINPKNKEMLRQAMRFNKRAR